MYKEEHLEETVEYLDEELQKTFAAVEEIAMKVSEGELDAYEGFLQTQKYDEKIAELAQKLKEKGIDITQNPDYQNL